jgi:hypothetical protein
MSKRRWSQMSAGRANDPRSPRPLVATRQLTIEAALIIGRKLRALLLPLNESRQAESDQRDQDHFSCSPPRERVNDRHYSLNNMSRILSWLVGLEGTNFGKREVYYVLEFRQFFHPPIQVGGLRKNGVLKDWLIRNVCVERCHSADRSIEHVE